MKYGAKVIDLLESYPETGVSMNMFVKSINPQVKGLERENIRRQVRRILKQLELMGKVHMNKGKQTGRGCMAVYMWIDGRMRLP